METIIGNVVGSSSTINVVQLVCEDGTVLEGIVAAERPNIDATAKDIRRGKTAITQYGVTEGEADMAGLMSSSCDVTSGEPLSIYLPDNNRYNYTTFQCVVVLQRDNAVIKYFSINDAVYSVETATKVSDITKNADTKSIDFNIVNESEDIYTIIYVVNRDDE